MKCVRYCLLHDASENASAKQWEIRIPAGIERALAMACAVGCDLPAPKCRFRGSCFAR
jgi:hypothetical protein